MPRKTYSVTEAELAVLDALWNEGELTIRQITDSLYEEGTTSEYATVQKLLDRLRAKGCVKRSKRSHAHQFSAKITRSELIGSGLDELARKLCSGSMTPLLMHLTETASLSKEDREKLRQLVNQS